MASARFKTSPARTPLEARRRREAWLALGAVLGPFFGLMGGVLLYLWLSWQQVYWAERVTEARARLEQVTVEHEQLQAEVAQAFSLGRLAHLARQMGLVEPKLHYWPPQP